MKEFDKYIFFKKDFNYTHKEYVSTYVGELTECTHIHIKAGEYFKKFELSEFKSNTKQITQINYTPTYRAKNLKEDTYIHYKTDKYDIRIPLDEIDQEYIMTLSDYREYQLNKII